MSSPSVHIAQSVASTAVLYPVLGENAIVFGASIILIDIDHIFEYVADTKSFHPKGFFIYHDIVYKNRYKNLLVFNLFHTIECYLLLFWLAQTYTVFYSVLGGFLFHHLFDQISLIRMKKPFVRVFSIPEFLIRKKHCITSIRELFQCADINVNGIPNLDYWLGLWGISLEPDQKKNLLKDKV